MIYIGISLIMIIIGLIGIFKSKMPKITASSGFAAELLFYMTFYILVIFGFLFLIIETRRHF